MVDRTIETTVTGGQIQGIAGAGSVVIENFTIYNRAAEETAPPPDDAKPLAPSPYPGLAYFGPGDADLFFGRDAAIGRLADAVGRQSFTALVGASGSGKSSVVLAGLAPRLHAAGGWRFSHFRIGTELERNPFLALARALVPLYVASDSDTERLRNTRQLAESLAKGELTLRDVFADCRSRNKGRRILLIADQFEEAFTLVEDEAVRARFIDVLLAGFPDPSVGEAPDICLILTLRADFYGRALRHRPLADALQGRVENLGPMTRDELQAAILRPAENAGVAFEPGLAETLLDDVESKPGSLPLLQFALREMWGRQEKGKITRRCYDNIGGVEGALAQRAEAVFATLTGGGANPEMEKGFRRLFTRLVTLGEGQEDTRRVVERRELGDEAWSLAQRLAGEDNRLVVTNAPAFSRETVEVAHEALIRHWPKLVEWINRDRTFQSWLRQIRPNVELWSADPADEGPLLRGGMLAQATDWLARRHDELSPAEEGYIKASLAQRQRAEEEKEAARLAETARRQELAAASAKLAAEKRLRIWIAGAGVIVALLAVFGGYQAMMSARNAREAQQSRVLMAAGLSIKETDAGRPERGLLLALAMDPEGTSRAELNRISREDMPALSIALEHAIYTGVDFQRLQQAGKITAASWSSDGRFIVTASEDGTARIWDARTRQVLHDLVGHKSGILGAAFSADSHRVVTASSDKTARIWDVETGQLVKEQELRRHEEPIDSVAFSPDGRYLSTHSGDGMAVIWDLVKGNYTVMGRPVGVSSVTFSPDSQYVLLESSGAFRVRGINAYQERPFKGHTGYVASAAFSPENGRIIVSTYSDGTARIWDAETGEVLQVLIGHDGWVSNAVFSPDGQRIVTTSGDKTARVWDAATGQELLKLVGHTDGVLSAAFSRDGRRIVTASEDHTAKIWDAETGQELQSLSGHSGAVRAATFSPDEQHVLTRSDDTSASVWRVKPNWEAHALAGPRTQIWSAAFTPDGHRLVTASQDHEAWLWDAETGKVLRSFDGPVNLVSSGTFSPDGRRVVSASGDVTAKIWDLDTSGEPKTLVGHADAVLDAAFSPDGQRVVTLSRDAKIWDANSAQLLQTLTSDKGWFVDASFSPDGRRVVIASGDGTARLWNVETGQLLATLAGHTDNIMDAAFSPDGQRVVILSRDAKIWDANSAQLLQTLTSDKGWFVGASFSPDGRRIATASGDRTARLWDVDTGQEVHAFAGHQAAVLSVAFSPDGQRLVTVSADHTLGHWTLLPFGSQIWDQAYQLKRRDLTEVERRGFFLSQ
ncbi:nSTAND1 domain-containing NTPase [Inquilinus sp. CA228]|uniref:nSTAND1 domain-containing NTPase n=1 Tax=Inquilinus sp. CA228 TaxID=3455609 RepID=UPI003F8D4803